jgi:hypothetical protein
VSESKTPRIPDSKTSGLSCRPSSRSGSNCIMSRHMRFAEPVNCHAG